MKYEWLSTQHKWFWAKIEPKNINNIHEKKYSILIGWERSAKCVIQIKLHIKILDYDWLMNNRVWSGPMKSFVFKSSARSGWRNFSMIAWYAWVFFCLTISIFLLQFGINKQFFKRPQSILILRARAILSVFKRFTRVYLFQIALEIMWLPIRIRLCECAFLEIFS